MPEAQKEISARPVHVSYRRSHRKTTYASEKVHCISDDLLDAEKHLMAGKLWAEGWLAVRRFTEPLVSDELAKRRKPEGLPVFFQEVLYLRANGRIHLQQHVERLSIQAPQLRHLRLKLLVCQEEADGTEQPTAV